MYSPFCNGFVELCIDSASNKISKLLGMLSCRLGDRLDFMQYQSLQVTFLYGMHGAGTACILAIVCTDEFPVFRLSIAVTMKIQFAFAVGTEQNPCKDTLFTEVRSSAFALTNTLYNVPCVLINDRFLRILNELMLRFGAFQLSMIFIGWSGTSKHEQIISL